MITERLEIRPFTLDDAPFILELLNTPGWLKFIGDKGVNNLEDAESYLLNGPIKAYSESNYGLKGLSLLENQRLIGTCGLLKRAYLDHPDIGFALLPEYYRCGFIFESAIATLRWAKETLDLKTVAAITEMKNEASINLLLKLGFEKQNPIVRDEEVLNLFEKNL